MRKLLQRLFQRSQNKALPRRKANRRPNLALERLEDRTVPSGFTVTFSETGVPGTTVTVTDQNPVNSLGGPGDINPAVGTISVTGLTVGDFTVSGQSSFSNSSQGTLPAVVTSTLTAFNNDPGVSHQLIITTLDTGFNVPPGGTPVSMKTTLADTSPLTDPTDTFVSTLAGVNGTTLTSTSSPSAASVTDSETIPSTPYSLGNTLSVTIVGAAPIGGAGNSLGQVQAQGTTKITAPANPEIAIVKLTNGTNNDSPPVPGVPDGPIVPVGSTVTWTYDVTNPGTEPIANVAVTDNIAGVNPTPVLGSDNVHNAGDTNDNGLLDPGEQWVYTANGTAIAGQYSNIGTVTGTSTVSNTPLTATNPDHYFGETPTIQIVKLTNGTNNDSPPVAGTPDGPIVPVGSTVTWTYDVTATGSNVPLSNITVVDNIAGVNPTPVLGSDNVHNIGDTNNDGLLEPGETWVFTASGTAIAGQYSNIGTATGTPPMGPNVTATNPDHYFGYTTNISILKLTNGTNNDNPPVAGTPDGPIVPVGSTVTWTYDVSTTGNVPLSSVAVTDNIAGVNPTPVLSGGFNVGDTNHDGLLEAGETWVFTASGTAIAGQYSNIGTATGVPSTPAGTPIPGAPTQTATNPDHYFGETPAIQIVKLTNGTNNDSPPVAGTPDGPIVPVGSTVTWTYNVTDTGSNVPLSNVTVTDNIAGVNPTPVLSGGFNVGDTNHDGLLEPGETWVFTASGTAIAGQYSNIGTATGTPPTGPNVTATNPDHYFGYTTNISILKLTNGTNNDNPPVAGTPDGPIVPVGSTVTWTYDVSTTGNVPLSSVAVTDNIAGVNPTPVLSGGFNVGDTNHDGLLEAGETWVFTASGTAIAGQYSNIGTATGTPSTPAGTPIPGAPTQTATNPDHYFGATPQLSVTKVADLPTVVTGSTAGYTVTISNPTMVAVTGLTLSDPLPAGAGSDINWMIDTSTGNPADFQITGSVGSQTLGFSSSFLTTDSLAANTSISVHITGLTHTADSGTGGSTLSALGAAGAYAVLYEGDGGHNLQVTNVTVNGSVAVGGTGHVQFNGPGTIAGRLDFSAASSGQYSNNNSNNVGPTSVNYSVANVATALNTINTLNTSLGALAGTSISFNNSNQTVNESAGTLGTVGSVTYRVFNVTSYSENNGDLVTIVGDGSGDPVVFNFGFNSNVNLGGDVALAGTGLTSDDDVIWNFTTSGKNINLNNNASSYKLPLAFHGILLAPNDALSLVNANLDGRVFGGDNSDMQIVSGDTINAPSVGSLVNTATVGATAMVTQMASSTIVVTSPPLLAAGSSSSAGVGLGELLGSSQLQTDTLGVAIDLPAGPETGAEVAAIRAAMATLNSQLAPLGITLVDDSGANAASAAIHITLASTTSIGGVDQGVLGAYTAGGDITLVSGWNWYFSSDPGTISPNQFDFQTVVTHELGHALGLGESSDPASVMYLYLTPGEVQHDLTATDLDAIRQELPVSTAAAVSDPATSGLGVAATNGASSTGNNFDNIQNVAINGTTFNDLTGNGSSNDDPRLASTITDANSSSSSPEVPMGLAPATSLPSSFVADVSNAGPSAVPSDDSRQQSDLSSRETLPPLGLAISVTSSPVGVGSSVLAPATTPAIVQPAPEIPNAVASLSSYRSGSGTGDWQENGNWFVPVTSFTVDTDAKEVDNSTPVFGDSPSRALDGIFKSLQQSERGYDSRLLDGASVGEVSEHFSMPDLLMTGVADEGETVPSQSIGGENWEQLNSPAIALMLAVGYTAVTAGVEKQTDRQRRSERFARP